jgi:hypothetical protein
MIHSSTEPSKIPIGIVIAAALAGAVMGIHQIANTSVGWHLASGDWILSNRAFLYADPFSFTSGGAPWIDHEWLFQVTAAIAYSVAGPAALVALRALTAVILAVLLLVVGTRSGLSPAAALVFSLLCVAGARERFFVRPELATLLIVPTAVWLFLRRERFSSPVWLAGFAALMMVGANMHGGVLVVPILLTGILAAECAEMAVTRHWRWSSLLSGVLALVTAVVSLLANPYGWHLFAVPIRLAHLVDQEYIPNPEWVSPTLAQAPALYLAMAVAFVILALRERRFAYWALFLLVSVLALRHIRNVGIFFVLLPLSVAPSLATWSPLSSSTPQRRADSLRADMLAVAAVLLLALSLAIAPRPRFGLGFAADYYPDAACAFLDREGLPSDRLYNDVRFGGYLIHRYGPERGVFQDDRNEIHEPLLRRIWEIFQASDVNGWSDLLAEHGANTALVRYHEPLKVTDPDGSDLGLRGFSALWFPPRFWALVYWDDVAMVFVHRDSARADLLDRHEYRFLRPDDLAYLEARLAVEPELKPAVTAELARAATAAPSSWRVREIAGLIGYGNGRD